MRPPDTDTVDPRIQADSEFRRDHDATCDELASAQVSRRLQDRDHTLWRPEPDEIADRLGWLEVVDWMRPRLEEVREAAEQLVQSVALIT